MANREEMEETYSAIDEIFRLNFGENGDITCALYNGDFSKTLEQAQKDKHEYILKSLHCRDGSRVLDIGCGWGPMLKAVQERGGHGIGLTLSSKQVEACKRCGLEAHVKDWKDVHVDTFGKFDGIIAMGVLEHACSVEEYLAGKQDQIYDHFFRLCHELLVDGGRLYLQTMLWGENVPEYQSFSLKATKGSNEYILAVLEKFYPGSWLPFGEGHLLKVAQPYFELVSDNNGRLDYIETMKQWRRIWHLSFSKLIPYAKLLPLFLTDKDFRYKLEELWGSYNKKCFERKVMDHQRMVFQKR